MISVLAAAVAAAALSTMQMVMIGRGVAVFRVLGRSWCWKEAVSLVLKTVVVPWILIFLELMIRRLLLTKMAKMQLLLPD